MLLLKGKNDGRVVHGFKVPLETCLQVPSFFVSSVNRQSAATVFSQSNAGSPRRFINKTLKEFIFQL